MLSTEQIALLDFEGSSWVEGGPKDLLIELRLGLSAAAYYDHLLALLDDPEARAHDPLTVFRVRAQIEPPEGWMAGAG
jgi:Protein of unknown function (DUF3263)